MQSKSLKLTIKLKHDISVKNSMNGITRPSNDAKVQSSPTNNAQQIREIPSTEDEENPSENHQNQLVIYDPNANGAVETDIVPTSPTQHPKVYPYVCAFTVQCRNCFKWRIVPTKEKYEEIREHILEVPFFCKTGREWQPDLSCDDPPDIAQDGSMRWAIDKPNISQAPPGWQRVLKFRCEGSSKFADVYYLEPLGRRLRSMVEITSFLNEHPEYVNQGINLSQFSFQTPKRLRDKSVSKSPALASPASDVSDHGMRNLLLPSEVVPLSGTSLDVNTDLQLSIPGFSNSPGSSCEVQVSKKKRSRLNKSAGTGSSLETKKKRNGGVGPGGLSLETQLSKKKRTPSKRMGNTHVAYNQNKVNLEDTHQL